MSDRFCILLLLCFLTSSCRLPASTAQSDGALDRGPAKQSEDVEAEEPLDPILLDLLQQQQQIMKPFAWGGPREAGIVIGIDEHDRLKTIHFGKTEAGYKIRKSEPFRSLENQSIRMKKSGSLALQGHLTEREFPFKADVITMERCQVHFVVVERALVRSLRNTQSPLTAIDVKIIVARDSNVVSSDNAGLSFFGVGAAFLTDINGDGMQDYVFIGEDNSKFIYIWTVEPNCAVKPVLFEFEDNNRPVTERSVSGRELFLRTDKSTGGSTVHTRSSAPYIENGAFYWRKTESVYKWQRQESHYRRVKQFTWLEKSE